MHGKSARGSFLNGMYYDLLLLVVCGKSTCHIPSYKSTCHIPSYKSAKSTLADGELRHSGTSNLPTIKPTEAASWLNSVSLATNCVEVFSRESIHYRRVPLMGESVYRSLGRTQFQHNFMAALFASKLCKRRQRFPLPRPPLPFIISVHHNYIINLQYWFPTQAVWYLCACCERASFSVLSSITPVTQPDVCVRTIQ